MSLKEKKNTFLKIPKEIRTPNEHYSNISYCAQFIQRKLIRLKNYDFHLLIQEIFP